jgi:hypothetical protein
MHRYVDLFLYNNHLDALIPHIYFGMKMYMFGRVSLSIIRSYALYTQQWYVSYGFVDIFRAGYPARKLSV